MKAFIFKGMFCLLAYLFISNALFAQTSTVSIGTETLKDKAVLWLKASGNQGLLLPVVSRSAFTGLNNSDEKGMLIFDPTDNKVYFWNGTTWVEAGGGSTASNQVLTLNGNTFSLTGSPASSVPLANNTPATGQALIWNGTAWTAASLSGDVTGTATTTQVTGIRGKSIPTLPASTQALVYDGTNWVFQAIGGGGETNTASNVGTGGVGVFKQKTGANLEFQKINAGSNRVSVTQDTPNSEVDIDVNQANLSIASSQVTGLGALATLNTVNTAQLTDGAVTTAKLAPSGASNGQVLKFNGTTWVAAVDDVGGGATPTLSNGQILTGNGTTNAASTLTGDASLSGGTLIIANNAITSAKIADGTITAADLNAMSATANQVLQYNGTVWAPATLAAGGSVTSVALTLPGIFTVTGSPITTSGTLAATLASQAANTIWAAPNGSAGSPTFRTLVPADIPNLDAAKITSGTIPLTQGGTGATTAAAARTNLGLGTLSTLNAVGSTEITNGSIQDIDIANASITAAKLAASGASNGQILKFNGTTWVAAADDVGGGATPTLSNGQILTGNGTTNAASTLTGDATLSGGAITIANNAITTAKINNAAVDATKLADNAVTSAKIVDGTITAADLNAMSATANQVLQYNGTVWAPATLAAGGSVTSVALTLPGIFTVTGSPITTSGTLAATLASQAANTIWAAPNGSAGSPTFRTLVAADIPNLDAAKITTGTIPVTQGGTGATTTAAARTNLGLGTLATLNTVGSTEITDGSITGADLATNISISTTGNIATTGTGTLSVAGATTLSALGGSGAQMVVVDNAGLLGKQAIPTAGWELTGNAGTNPATNFIGTTDAQPLRFATGVGGVERMRISPTGNVGIGISAPNNLLHVNDPANTQGTFQLTAGTATGTTATDGLILSSNATAANILNRENTPLFLGTNGINRVTVSGAGNVGIGTSTPNAPLQLANAVGRRIVVWEAGNNDHEFIGFGVGGAGTFESQIPVNSNAFLWKTGTSATTSNELMRLTGLGNLGIGTATPAAKLDIAGTIKITDGTQGVGKVLVSDANGLASWGTFSGSALSTLNVIPKGNGTGQVASQLFDNGTNVGINNATPAQKLDVGGNINIGSSNSYMINSLAMMSNAGTANIFVGGNNGTPTGSNLAFFGRGAGANNGSASDNTFIGRNAGSQASTGGFNAFFGKDAGNATTTGTGNTFLGNETGATNLTGSRNVLIGRFANVSASNLTNAIAIGFSSIVGASDAMVLGGAVGSGNEVNVGIGVTTPLDRLHVDGSIRFTSDLKPGGSAGTAGQVLRSAGSGNVPTWVTPTTFSWGITGNSGTVPGTNYVGTSDAVDLAFATNGTRRMVIDASGRVGINTTTPLSGAILDIVPTGTGIGNIKLRGSSVNPTDPVDIDFVDYVGTTILGRISMNPSNPDMWFATNGTTVRMRIMADGKMGIGRTPTTNLLEVEGEASKTTASGWLANSDRRIKTDIKDITNGIEVVKKLRPVMFRYTDEWMKKHPSIKNQYYYNFIAQEFQQVFPDAVKGSGEFIDGDDQEILQVDTYNAQIVTIKAVQELIAKIELLEAENQKLKSEKGTLEAKVTSIEDQQKSLLKDVEELKRILGAAAKK
ncbi:MAG: tail fiber domain-containing protein [Cyclobacteriaceae bacterium]|nr:tail fiber domain-containing protein [Cyclobacteriaceae bacterium]